MNTNFNNILAKLQQYIGETPISVIRQDLINAGHGIIDDCELVCQEDALNVHGGVNTLNKD